MKTSLFFSALLLSSLGGEAMAACAAPSIQVTGTGTQETAVVTFRTLNVGASVSVGGLTLRHAALSGCPSFFNSVSIAAQFANKANGVSPANPTTTPPGCLTWDGTALNGWSSGAASSSLVTFSSATVGNSTGIATSNVLSVVATQGMGTLNDLLTGNTVCVSNGAGGWDAQELHQSGGNLVDYKLGPGHAIDPSTSVGSWSISGSTVTYSYGTGGTYNNAVWDNGDGTYSFCNPAETVGTIKAGSGPCP